MGTIEKFDSYVMGTYGRYPLVMEKGENCRCVDENGNHYVDFGSGIGTNSLGYCDSDWVEAVCNQVQNLQHTSNYYYTKVQADFAAKLCSATGYAKVFFGNSGAEANECAIKIARKYSFDKYGENRNKIITLCNSFHGRTMCTLSATGQDVFHNYFFPFMQGFDYAQANNIDDLEAKLDGSVCAVMIEFVQGEGGVNVLDEDFVRDLFELCKSKDILVIADEVQTGIGRTGKLLAAQNYNVRADITTLAKGLAGGLPIGACLVKDKCAEVLTKGMHGSTFGGNPVCCAGGNAVLNKVCDANFLDEVVRKGRYIRARLEALDEVVSVSGMGLMIGVTLKTKNAADVAKLCLENGLLVLTAKEKLRFLPPLTISQHEIEAGMEILEKLLSN